MQIYTVTSLTIIKPDDWHLHVRDTEALRTVVPHTAARFARAIIMPNLKPPVTTVAAAQQYRQRILQALAPDTTFNPLMTLYLTDKTTAKDIIAAKQSQIVFGVKYYPAGATTNSDEGVTDIKNTYDTLTQMQASDIPLLVHGEVTNREVDVFDREKYFIDQVLSPLQLRFPDLRIVFEHITTKEAVEFVTQSPNTIAATITPQHLLFSRNAMFQGGIRPHYYCLPVLKRETHRQALIAAATSANPKFFLGTDSAPHSRIAKESACGCAGIYSAHAAIELYAMAFEQANALDKLENFASRHGAQFYGLPINRDTITLTKLDWEVPAFYEFAGSTLIPLFAQQKVTWQLTSSSAIQ
jgi:dihydroorotase